MTTKQLTNIYLEATIDALDFACQIAKVTDFTPPSRAKGKAEYPACPPNPDGTDVVVLTPGAPQEGKAALDIWHDTTATGITTALITAQQAGTTIDYTIVWRFDDPAADYQWSGKATVEPISNTWDKTDSRESRGPVNLTILSAVFGRPAPQAPAAVLDEDALPDGESVG